MKSVLFRIAFAICILMWIDVTYSEDSELQKQNALMLAEGRVSELESTIAGCKKLCESSPSLLDDPNFIRGEVIKIRDIRAASDLGDALTYLRSESLLERKLAVLVIFRYLNYNQYEYISDSVDEWDIKSTAYQSILQFLPTHVSWKIVAESQVPTTDRVNTGKWGSKWPIPSENKSSSQPIK